MIQFDFSKEYILENSIARLEPLALKHIEVLEEIALETDVWTYFLGRSNGKDDFKTYIKGALEARDVKKAYPFAVFDKRVGSYAGCTRFFDFTDDFMGVRLGYTWFGRKFRGTGLNKNCKYLMFQFAFEELDMVRVGLGAHSENSISIAAMKSVGCKEEGRIREVFPSIHHSGRADAILLSILAREWFESAKNQLKNKL